MRDAWIGIGAAIGLLVMAPLVWWAVTLLPEPQPTVEPAVVMRTGSGWGGLWIALGLVILGRDIYVTGNRIADALTPGSEPKERDG